MTLTNIPDKDIDRILMRSFVEIQNKTLAKVYHALKGQVVTQQALAGAFGKKQETIAKIIKRYTPHDHPAYENETK